MTSPDPQVPSRSARIWRRTRMGLTLGSGIIAALWAAAVSEAGMPIAVVASLMTFAAAWEVSRMGTLAGRRLELALLGPIAAAVLLSVDHVRHATVQRYAGYESGLLQEVVLVLTLAALGLLGARLLAKAGMETKATRAGLAVLLVLIAFLAVDWLERESGWVSLALIALSAIGVLVAARSKALIKSEDLYWALGLTLWIALPLTWIWHVWERFGPASMVALVVFSKVGDIAAYYGGNAFGKHHPLPNLSPGKTLEGFACSIGAGALTGAIFSAIGALNGNLMAGVLAGLIVNVASQSGDLLESWVKRRVGVKDSSAAFGPSGGVLDVVDSLLLAAPIALFTWPWLFPSG